MRELNFVFWAVGILFITVEVFWLPSAHAQEDGEESDAGDDVTNTTTGTVLCYTCNNTDVCAAEQNSENGTKMECQVDEHCWTWKTEMDEVVTYIRNCGDPCTDESRELDCKSIDNQTECALCCDDELCNGNLLGGASSRLLFSTIQSILAISTISVLLLL